MAQARPQRRPARDEAAVLLRLYGAEAPEVALDRAFAHGLTPEERLYWRRVSVLAACLRSMAARARGHRTRARA